MDTIRIAIADDEVLFRKGMELLINDFQGMEIIFEASNGQDLIEKLRNMTTLPDVILLDLNMPTLNGVETAKILKSEFPSLSIIILSTHFSKGIIFNLIELGVSSYLAKNTEPDIVEFTIREVIDKGFHYNDEIQKIIRENFFTKQKRTSNIFNLHLTKREKEVLQHICEEYTNAEIAKKLFISQRTVEGHRNNLLTKLGCKNSAGLVVFALKNNLVVLSSNRYLG